MQVKLKRDWFGPGGVRMKAKDRASALFIRELPDTYLDALPSDAEVYDEKGHLIGTAEEIRSGEFKAKKPVAVSDDVARKAAYLEKVEKAVEAAKKAVAEAEAAVKAEASDKNVKAVNEAKASLVKAEAALAKAKE